MKILNVNMTLDPLTGGGTAERTFQMSRALAALGADITLLALDLGVTDERLRQLTGVKVVLWRCINTRFYLPWPRLLQLYRLVKRADVVQLTGHWTLMNALVFLYIKALGKKYIVCPAGSLKVFGRSGGIKKLYNKLIGKAIIQQADKHVAISENEIPMFESYGVQQTTISNIPNGIHLLDYQQQVAGKPPYSKPYLLFLGRLNRIKGADLLYDAYIEFIKHHPQYHIVFAGPDEGLLAPLQQAVRADKLEDKVFFTGYVSGDEKLSLLANADLLVIPSRSEAMSIVILEAGALGVPVLATDQCGLADFAQVGACRLVAVDAESIARGMIELMSDEDALGNMANVLRDEVQRNYTWACIGRRYLQVFAAV